MTAPLRRSLSLALVAATVATVSAARANAGQEQVDALRRTCEAGLAMSVGATLPPTAVQACHQAFLMTHSPREMRNKVAALMLEKAKPDLDTVAVASLLADAAVKSAPDQAWGYLARHDIARTLGRADLLAASRTDLLPFVAREPLARAAVEARVGRASFGTWLVRIFVLLGLAATALHAFRHRRAGARAAPAKASSAAPAAVALVLLSVVTPSRALGAAPPADMPVMKDGQISRFKIDDAHPEKAVEQLAANTKDPLQLGYLLQDLAARADQAHKEGDHARAARYYHALGVAAPTPYGPRMECQALEAVGDIAGAIRACRELLTRGGSTVNDYVHFVEVVLQNPQPLPALEPRELEGVIAHLETQVKTPELPTVLRCKVAMRFEDPAGLDRCAAAIGAAPAADPTTISIKWGLAVRRNDTAAALRLLDDARRAGVGADKIEKMRQTTNAISRGRLRKAGGIGGLVVFLCIAGFFGARLLGSTRRRGAASQPAL